MAPMNEVWVYNNGVIGIHPLAAYCKSTLRDVSEKDYPGSNYFNPDIECLDLDAYVKSKHLARTPKTMDAAMGISNIIQNRTVSPRILLVEFRMDYESNRQLSASELKEKNRESRAVVTEPNTTLYPNPVFLFTEKCIEEVRSWHSRQIRVDGTLSEWMFMSVSEFEDMVKDVTSIPVTYIHDVDKIRMDVKSVYKNQGMEAFVEQILFWADKVRRYEWKYNIEESNHLKEALKDIWCETIIENFLPQSDDDRYWIEIIEEELDFLI